MNSDKPAKYSKDAYKKRCTYSCGNCGIVFDTELSLMLHIANAHPDSLSSLRVVREVTTIFRCRLCEDEFTYLSDFNSHMSVHGHRLKTTIPIIAERIQVTKKKALPASAKAKPISKPTTKKPETIASKPSVHTRCFTCGKKFTESSGFSALDSVNFCIMPTLECSKCKLIFPTAKQLDEHNKIHTESSESQSKETSQKQESQENETIPDQESEKNLNVATSQPSAPIKLLKIEENINQQFKLYTCSDCNIKFANNITKAKKMLIPCSNFDQQVALGVPLNGPESDAQPVKMTGTNMIFRQYKDSSGVKTLIPFHMGIPPLSTENGTHSVDSKIRKDHSVLVGHLQKHIKGGSQAGNVQASDAVLDIQESKEGANVMSGILPDGSEFVIMETEPSDCDVNTTDTSIKPMSKSLKSCVKVKIEPIENPPGIASLESDLTNPCVSDDVPKALPTETWPLVTIKPDPDALSSSVQTDDTDKQLENENSNEDDVHKCLDVAEELQVLVKTEATYNSYEPVSHKTVCQVEPQKSIVTRSKTKLRKQHQIPLKSDVSTKALEDKNLEELLTKHQNTSLDKSHVTDASSFLKKQQNGELELDCLLAVEKPLEGISNLQSSNISNNSSICQRVPSDDLDKLLCIEQPFWYNDSSVIKEEKEEAVIVKMETDSPVIDSNSVSEAFKSDKWSILPMDNLDKQDNTEDKNTSELQVYASSSTDNAMEDHSDLSISPVLKTIKTEPDKVEEDAITKSVESWPTKTDDECETEYNYQSFSQLENGYEDDISCLPKLCRIKEEKEDLSYERCAEQFPGISAGSDSSSDDLQDSKDPNLYSVSQVKQEPGDSDRLLRVRQDLFGKKVQKNKCDDQILLASETDIDSPYLQSDVKSLDQKTDIESCNDNTSFDPSNPIERIFVPQSILGVHRMQLNDVLNSIKQKQVEAGSDLVDLLNEEAISSSTLSWRKNYRKRIADLIAGKKMTMEQKIPPKKYPNVQNKRRAVDLSELHAIRKAKTRPSKRSYYGRKIAELTALNKGMEDPLHIQEHDKKDEGQPQVTDNAKAQEVHSEKVDKSEETKSQSSEANVSETRNTSSPPFKRRNFYEKRIAELRAFEDIDILQSETMTVRLSKDSVSDNSDGDDSKRNINFQKRMADLDIKLKAIREGQKSKKSNSKSNSNSKPNESVACPTCKGAFDDQDSTIEHMMKVHGSKVVYKCDFCSKMFQSKEDKVQHQFVHIEETKTAVYKMLQSDQFKCNICDTNFLFSQSLIEHFRKFHSDKTDSDS